MSNRSNDDYVLKEVFTTKIEAIEEDIKEMNNKIIESNRLINESNKFQTEVLMELKENTGVLTALMVQSEKRMDKLDEIADKRAQETNLRLDRQDDKLDTIGIKVTEIESKNKNGNWLSRFISHPNFKLFAWTTIGVIGLILLFLGIIDPVQFKKFILWIFTGV